MQLEEEDLVSRIIQGKADLGRIRAERVQRKNEEARSKAKVKEGTTYTA